VPAASGGDDLTSGWAAGSAIAALNAAGGPVGAFIVARAINLDRSPSAPSPQCSCGHAPGSGLTPWLAGALTGPDAPTLRALGPMFAGDTLGAWVVACPLSRAGALSRRHLPRPRG